MAKGGFLNEGMCLFLPIVAIIGTALLGLGTAQIVIGAIYLNDCPREPMIPVWLIVEGVIFLIILVIKGLIFATVKEAVKETHRHLTGRHGELAEAASFNAAGEMKHKTREMHPCLRFAFTLMIIFGLAWLIYGSVIVFRSRPDYNATPFNGKPGNGTDPMYCSPVPMEFATAILVLHHVALLIALIISCCACWRLLAFIRNTPPAPAPEPLSRPELQQGEQIKSYSAME
jgi:hypothetical protein